MSFTSDNIIIISSDVTHTTAYGADFLAPVCLFVRGAGYSAVKSAPLDAALLITICSLSLFQTVMERCAARHSGSLNKRRSGEDGS